MKPTLENLKTEFDQTGFWLADAHFGHGNICKYCNRPWLKKEYLAPDGSNWVSPEAAVECAERMNAGLIHNINQRVNPGDQVIHVGDFCTRGPVRGGPGLKNKQQAYLEQLNGDWTLIEGNHDKQNKVKCQAQYMVTKIGHYTVLVNHYPLHAESDPWDVLESVLRLGMDFVICGHVHEKWGHLHGHVSHGIPPLLNINVGVDQHRYMPITDQEVLTIYERLKK
jgi:calcineurin-like phosphoesterase family protein